MMPAAAFADSQSRSAVLGEEAFSISVGVAVTLTLFLAMAHFQHRGRPPTTPEIEDVRMVSLPLQPPPPQPQPEVAPAAEPMTALTGIEIAAAESPVKIAVGPQDLAALFPESDAPPPAQITVGRLFPDLKPHVDVSKDLQHVYQQAEVDRIPTVIYRATPKIPRTVRNNALVLRVTLLLTVDQNGSVASIRLLRGSGNPDFDEIVTACVQNEWAFTPAMKNGRKVRCLLQQAIAVKWPGRSPFET